MSTGTSRAVRRVEPDEPITESERKALLADRWNAGFLARDIHRLFRSHLRERLIGQPYVLSLWSYLWALFKEDGLAQNELAKRVRLVGPSVVAAINLMEKHQLAVRVRSETDRRVVHVHLTAKGKALEPLVTRIAVELNEFAMAELTDDEIETLAGLLRRVRSRLETSR